MKKAAICITILLIGNIGLCQRISSNDLDYYVNVDNSVYEEKISKIGFVLESTIEHLEGGRIFYIKKFRKEQTGESIERLEWDENKIQIWYSFIGVERQKNAAYKKFKNDFLFNEYILIHEAVTDDPSYYARNTIEVALKNSNGTRVSLENSFTTRHFSGSGSNKENDYTHWIKIHISSW